MRNANGTGAVIKLSGNRRKPYAVRITTGWTDTGKQLYKYVGYYESQRQAVIGLAEYLKEPIPAYAGITFLEVHEAWKAQYYDNVSDSTIQAHNLAFKRCEALYAHDFNQLRVSHLQSIVDKMTTYATKHQIKKYLACIYAYALRKELVTRDLSKLIDLGAPNTTKERYELTFRDVKKIWDNMDKYPYADLFLMLLYTGFRVSELLEIPVCDINITEGYFKGGMKTSAGKNRIVPIHTKILPLVQSRLLANEKYLFPGYNKPNAYRHLLERYHKPMMRELNITCTGYHDSRVTFISALNRANVDNLVIKRLVGHANKDVTEHYAKVNLDDLRQAIKEIRY